MYLLLKCRAPPQATIQVPNNHHHHPLSECECGQGCRIKVDTGSNGSSQWYGDSWASFHDMVSQPDSASPLHSHFGSDNRRSLPAMQRVPCSEPVPRNERVQNWRTSCSLESANGFEPESVSLGQRRQRSVSLGSLGKETTIDSSHELWYSKLAMTQRGEEIVESKRPKTQVFYWPGGESRSRYTYCIDENDNLPSPELNAAHEAALQEDAYRDYLRIDDHACNDDAALQNAVRKDFAIHSGAHVRSAAARGLRRTVTPTVAQLLREWVQQASAYYSRRLICSVTSNSRRVVSWPYVRLATWILDEAV